MIRAPHSFSVAVRREDGSISVHSEPVRRPSERYPLLRFPILRGLGTLGQAMWLGVRALRFSAQMALGAEAKPEKRKDDPSAVSDWAMTLNLIFSVGFFLA